MSDELSSFVKGEAVVVTHGCFRGIVGYVGYMERQKTFWRGYAHVVHHVWRDAGMDGHKFVGYFSTDQLCTPDQYAAALLAG